MINGIHRDMHQDLLQRWHLKDLYDGLYARRQELEQLHSGIHDPARTRSSEGSWNFRDVHSAVTAVPFLLNAGQAIYERKPKYPQSGQTVSQGLIEMFMAQDKYRREQIFAGFKEDQAKQKYIHDLGHDDIMHITKMLNHNCQLAELTSKIMARGIETSHKILGNM